MAIIYGTEQVSEKKYLQYSDEQTKIFEELSTDVEYIDSDGRKRKLVFILTDGDNTTGADDFDIKNPMTYRYHYFLKAFIEEVGIIEGVKDIVSVGKLPDKPYRHHKEVHYADTGDYALEIAQTEYKEYSVENSITFKNTGSGSGIFPVYEGSIYQSEGLYIKPTSYDVDTDGNVVLNTDVKLELIVTLIDGIPDSSDSSETLTAYLYLDLAKYLPTVKYENHLEIEEPIDPEIPEEPEIPVDPEEPTDPTDPEEPEVPVDPEEPTDPETPEEPEIPIEPVPEPEPTPEELFVWTEQTTTGKYPVSYSKDKGIKYMDLQTEKEIIDYDNKKRNLVLSAEKLDITDLSKFRKFNPLTYEYDIRIKIFLMELPFDPQGNTGAVSIGPYANLDVTKDRHKYTLNQFKSDNVEDLELMMGTQPKLFVYNSAADSVLMQDKFHYRGSILETVVTVKPKSFIKLENGKTKIIYDDAVIAHVNVAENKTERLTLNLGKWLSEVEVDVPKVSGFVDTQLFDLNGLILPLKSRLYYELVDQNVLENTSTFNVKSGLIINTNDYISIGKVNYSIQSNDLIEVTDVTNSITLYSGNLNKFHVYSDERYTFKHDSKGYIKDLKFELKGSAPNIKPFVNILDIKKENIPRIKQKSKIKFKDKVLGIAGTTSKVNIVAENSDYTHKWNFARDSNSTGNTFTEEYFKKEPSLGGPKWLTTRWEGFSGELEPRIKEFPMSFSSVQQKTIKFHFNIDNAGSGSSLMNWKDSDYGFIKLTLETYDEVDVLIGSDITYWKVERPNAAKLNDLEGNLSSGYIPIGITEPSLISDDYSYDVKIKDKNGNVLAGKVINSGAINNGVYDFPLSESLKGDILNSYPNSNYADLQTEVVTKYKGSPIGSNTGGTKLEIIDLDLKVLNTNGITYQDTKALTIAITGNNQKIIQGSSDLKIKIASNTFKVADGAYSDGYLITFGDAIREIKANFTSEYTFTFTANEIKNVSQDSELKVVATDSRGNKAQIVKNISVIPYKVPIIFPKISLISNFSSGVYVEVTVRVSRLKGSNTLNNLIVRYRQDSESENWLSLGSLDFVESTFTDDYTLYKSEKVLLSNVDLNIADYYFEYTTYDRLNESVEVSFEGKKEQIATIDTEKGSFGFGMAPKLDNSVALNVLEIGDFAIFRKTEDGVALEGTFTLDGLDIIEELTSLKNRLTELEK